MGEASRPFPIVDHGVQDHDPGVVVEVYRAFIANNSEILFGGNLLKLWKQALGLFRASFQNGNTDLGALYPDPVFQAAAEFTFRIVEYVKFLHMRASFSGQWPVTTLRTSHIPHRGMATFRTASGAIQRKCAAVFTRRTLVGLHFE